jgi:hypothetical protein
MEITFLTRLSWILSVLDSWTTIDALWCTSSWILCSLLTVFVRDALLTNSQSPLTSLLTRKFYYSMLSIFMLALLVASISRVVFQQSFTSIYCIFGSVYVYLWSVFEIVKASFRVILETRVDNSDDRNKSCQ